MSFDAMKWAMEQPVSHSPAKFVLLAMADESRDGETVWVATSTLSDKTYQDRKTVIKNVARLLQMGFIEDTGMRRGSTNQVIVYRFKTPEIGTLKEYQNRDSSKAKTPKSGTVTGDERLPNFPAKTPNFPTKESQISPERLPNLGHEPIQPILEPVSEPINLFPQVDPMDEPKSFADFWLAYPVKTGKSQCLAKWKAKGLDKIASVILADIGAKAASDRRWSEGYIPNPQTYINQERWNDPVQTKTAPSGKPPIAQQFANKTYHGTPDDELPDFLRTGTH